MHLCAIVADSVPFKWLITLDQEVCFHYWRKEGMPMLLNRLSISGLENGPCHDCYSFLCVSKFSLSSSVLTISLESIHPRLHCYVRKIQHYHKFSLFPLMLTWYSGFPSSGSHSCVSQFISELGPQLMRFTVMSIPNPSTEVKRSPIYLT